MYIRIWIQCRLCYRSLCRDFYFQFLIIFFLFNPVGGREAQDPPTRIHLLSLLYRPTSAAMLLPPLATAGIRAICSNQVPICDISLWKIHSFASSSFSSLFCAPSQQYRRMIWSPYCCYTQHIYLCSWESTALSFNAVDYDGVEVLFSFEEERKRRRKKIRKEEEVDIAVWNERQVYFQLSFVCNIQQTILQKEGGGLQRRRRERGGLK